GTQAAPRGVLPAPVAPGQGASTSTEPKKIRKVASDVSGKPVSSQPAAAPRPAAAPAAPKGGNGVGGPPRRPDLARAAAAGTSPGTGSPHAHGSGAAGLRSGCARGDGERGEWFRGAALLTEERGRSAILIPQPAGKIP